MTLSDFGKRVMYHRVIFSKTAESNNRNNTVKGRVSSGFKASPKEPAEW